MAGMTTLRFVNHTERTIEAGELIYSSCGPVPKGAELEVVEGVSGLELRPIENADDTVLE